jgi:peptidoglycan/LPS O-acetylase OafA/YrhL
LSEARGHAFGLDAIRVVAVGSVLLAHGSLFYTAGGHPGARYPLVVFGVLGVEIFFALSGFLVGRQLLRVADGRATALRFLARRWVRTLPNYYLFLAINAALVLWVLDRQHPDARFLVFAQALAWPATSAFFPESWSLAVEEWFYLLAAGAFAIAALCRASPRVLGIGLAILLAAGPVARLVAQSMVELPMDAGVRKISLLRLDSLAFGLACAALERHATPVFEHLKGPATRIAAAVVALASLAFLVLESTDLAFFEPARDAATRMAAALLFSALPLAAALFLPWLSAWRPRPNGATRALESVSAWSYSIYLVHFPLMLVLVDRWNVEPGGAVSMHVRTVAWLAGTFALAALVYAAYERPLMARRPALEPSNPAGQPGT